MNVFASVLSLPQQRGKCSLSYHKETNKRMHRTNVAPVLPATKGEFQKAGFVFVQPFVTTLGCARVEHRFMEAT